MPSSAHPLVEPTPTDTAPMTLGTGTGLKRDTFVPSPSWPWLLSPQHHTPPSDTAQLESAPACTEVAGGRLTRDGSATRPVTPRPNWPSALKPQHTASPVVSSAHPKFAPRLSAVASVSPVTGIGVVVRDSTPIPRAPNAPSPQHETAPARRRAQVKNAPPRTSTASVKPETGVGVVVLMVVPSPSWPEALRPQHTTCPSCNAQA